MTAEVNHVHVVKGAVTIDFTGKGTSVERILTKDITVIKRAMKTTPKARDRLRNDDLITITATFKTLVDYQNLWTACKDTTGTLTLTWETETFTVMPRMLKAKKTHGGGLIMDITAVFMIVSSDSS